VKLSRVLIALAAVAVLVALGAFLPVARTSEAGVRVVKVEPQDFVRQVPAQGNLQAVRATPITVPSGVPGPFRIGWVAPDGSRVKTGDVVIRFDPSAIEKQLIGAEDDLREARLKMEKEQVQGLSEVRKLERDAAMVARIRGIFESRQRSMPVSNERQADRPEGATFIPQERGTAPGLICPVGDGKVIYAIPGVPFEMTEMLDRAVIPDLKRRSGSTSVILSRMLRTWGIPESTLGELVADRVQALERRSNPTIAFLASGLARHATGTTIDLNGASYVR